jgi:trehalose synthase
MLRYAELAAARYSGTGGMWRHPYAKSNPHAALALASVWFTAYPASTITRSGESVVRTLGDQQLWQVFRQIGIQGMHIGPMKRAGGIRGREYTPTIDGGFDRIANEIDPAFGTQAEYLQLTTSVRARGGVVIGDIIPGHTGKGPDFRLAERAYKDYPGLYHMVQIDRQDWTLLPSVPTGKDSVNLKAEVVDQLKSRGYIVGQLPRTIFREEGVKDTDWSATDVVRGVDGLDRRWVYLHYFKEGQPTLNWLDPSFAAQRLVIGDALHSLKILGEGMLRLDANGFLGIESSPNGSAAWSEGHPLSVTANQLIAGTVRKLGAFTFQELNLTLEDLKAMSEGGADLSYDFVTRPAYDHALVTGDTEFLRLMLALMRKHRIDPAGLVHALQNHDELTIELVHFGTAHKDQLFPFRGDMLKGSKLKQIVIDEMKTKLVGDSASYNLKAGNGISCTSASLAAATLGIRDVRHLSKQQVREIQKLHLLLVMFNALQPGVFALSGWDLVGSLTLPADAVRSLLADGDTRWVNRGAYDLMGRDPSAVKSAAGLPLATPLYGSLPEQLKRPDSFASELQHILKVRQENRIHQSDQLESPQVKAKGLLVMVHSLPGKTGTEVTALNFGCDLIEEAVEIPGVRPNEPVIDLMEGRQTESLAGTRLRLRLPGFTGKAFLVKSQRAE